MTNTVHFTLRTIIPDIYYSLRTQQRESFFVCGRGIRRWLGQVKSDMHITVSKQPFVNSYPVQVIGLTVCHNAQRIDIDEDIVKYTLRRLRLSTKKCHTLYIGFKYE